VSLPPLGALWLVPEDLDAALDPDTPADFATDR